MRYFKKMLIPTDGCDAAKAGVLQALRISKLLGTKPQILIPVEEAGFFRDECESESFEAAEKIIDEVEEAAMRIELDVKIISKEGDSRKLIEDMLSNDEELNIITMGTKGHKDAKDVLLGTLHQHVIKMARIPVIIQPYFGKAYLHRFNEISEGKYTLGKHKVNLLLAMDGSVQAEAAAFEAIQFANQLNVGSRIVALHVAKSIKDADGNETTDPEEFMHIPNKAKEMGMKAGVIVEPEVRVGEKMALEILKRAAELRADMIIMGSHGRTGPMARFIGNKTEAVLESVPVPVMVVPPELRRSTMDIEAEEYVDDVWDGVVIKE